jgi:hypothetical protein
MNTEYVLSTLREIAENLPDDDPDKQAMLDQEADYSGRIEWAIRKRTEAQVMAQGCKELEQTYKQRKQSWEKKADAMRDFIGVLMNAAGETSYKGSAGTVSVKAVAPKPLIQDEDQIPDDYKKTTISIDKSAINEAVKNGETVPGVTLDNGGMTTQIRTN